MEMIREWVSSLNGIVWGPVMLVLILGVGLYLQAGLKLMPIRCLGRGFRLLFEGRKTGSDVEKDGEVSPFNALMTALSATVGTGNIAGVATAVFLGGPGALFWMWWNVTGLVVGAVVTTLVSRAFPAQTAAGGEPAAADQELRDDGPRRPSWNGGCLKRTAPGERGLGPTLARG